jgi:hypothetical protein
MKLLLRTWSTDDGASAENVCAYVDITKEVAQKIMKRAKALKDLGAVDKDLLEMCFFDHSPTFISIKRLKDKGVIDEREDGEVLQEIGYLNLDEKAEEFPHVFDNLADEDEVQGLELFRMTITEDYVIWEADEKYTNITLTTEGFSLSEIEKEL